MAVYRDIDSDVRINGSLTLPAGSLTIGGTNIISALNEKANRTTAINTGTGLTGGGALTADRTLAVSFGTTNTTVARGDHTHAFGDLTSHPTTLTGYGITDASVVGHTHTFASLTSKPTTLAGYGITNAALSTHHHDASYLKLSGGTLTGPLRVESLIEASQLTSGNQQIIATDPNEIYVGNPMTPLNLESSVAPHVYVYDQMYVMWYSGNFNPSSKANASTLTTHTNNTAIHKDWGNWATGGGGTDLTVSGKRALVYVSSSNKLMMNYGNDFAGGVEISGTLTNGGQEVWHRGNLALSTFVTSTDTGQKVRDNFTVLGRMWLGEGAGTSGVVGSLVMKGNTVAEGVQNAIQLGGSSALSNIKAFISETGTARFHGNVRMANMTIDTNAMVSNLNAEYVGGVKETKFVRTDSIRDIHGYGVKNGMTLAQKSPTPDMTLTVKAGIAYTDSGRRFELEDTIVPVTTASANYDRYDIVFMQGSKVRDTNGTVIANPSNEGRLSVRTGAAMQSPMADFTGLYSEYPDAIVLGTVYVRANIGTITDGTSGTYNALSATGRRLMSLRLIEDGSYNINESLSIGGTISEAGETLESKYAQLATDNLFTGNIKIRNSGGASLIVQSDNGHSSDDYPATLYLKEDDHFNHGLKVEYLGDSNMGVISTMQSGNKSERITISRSTGQVTLKQKVVVEGHFEAQRNAQTVTIAAGQTTTTWTHGYGSASYAVNLTTNSFERHIRWKDKTTSVITIEIDDPSSQDILVDCILIGY